jgi:hypothetical protein
VKLPSATPKQKTNRSRSRNCLFFSSLNSFSAAASLAFNAATARYRFEIRRVLIRDDGSGVVKYARWLGRSDAVSWTVTAFAGGEAECCLYPDRRGDAGDLAAIRAMMARLGLAWGESVLSECGARRSGWSSRSGRASGWWRAS